MKSKIAVHKHCSVLNAHWNVYSLKLLSDIFKQNFIVTKRHDNKY